MITDGEDKIKNSQFISTRSAINELLADPEFLNARILDLGCSDNIISVATHCLDYKPPPNLKKGLIFIEQDLNANTRLPFSDGYFDVVYCSHVLEHLEYPWLILEEISRIAKRGIIIVPTKLEDNLYSDDPIIKKGKYIRGRYGHKWWFDYDAGAVILISKRQRVIRHSGVVRSDFGKVRDLMQNLFEICFVFQGGVKFCCIEDRDFKGHPLRCDNANLPLLIRSLIFGLDVISSNLMPHLYVLRKRLNLRLRDRFAQRLGLKEKN